MRKSSAGSLDKIAQDCRRLGIRRLRVGDVEVEFWPAAPTPTKPLTKKEVDEVAKAFGVGNDPEDRCACGHSMATEHNDCGCLLGCDLALCATTEGGAKEK